MSRLDVLDDAFPPGTVIDGKFRVERVLGAGGMGIVLEVTNLTLGQLVAIKLLRSDEAPDSDTLKRFVQEARIVSSMTSENVVRVFDLGRTERGQPYIVMELLRGEDLSTLIANEAPVPVPRAVDLALGACAGVATAHAAGLVHRDLKPANLFVARRTDGSKVVKVLDFGLSKQELPESARLTLSAMSFGTPQYMAPEQIASAKHVDARCDQHALGMVLFELLTGRPPYEAHTPNAITVKIATMPPPSARPFRHDVAPALDAAIQRALAKHPDDRFEDVGAFACAIAPFGGADSVRRAAEVQSTLSPATRVIRPAAKGPASSSDATTLPMMKGKPQPAASAQLVAATSTPGGRGALALALLAAFAVALLAGFILASR